MPNSPSSVRSPTVLPLLDLEMTVHREIYFGMRQFALGHQGGHMLGSLRPDTAIATVLALHPAAVVGALWSAELVAALRRDGIVAVNISNSLPNLLTVSVLNDDRQTGQLAAEHFLARGFRQFGFCGFEQRGFSAAREQGFCAAVAAAGYAAAVFRQVFGTGPDESPRLSAGLVPWLRELPKPVAVFACNDYHASHVLNASQRLELRIPEEVAILGVDNEELFCRASEVPLSSVALAADRVGYEALALCWRLLGGAAPPRQPLLIAPRGVVARQSTDVIAVSDPRVRSALQFIAQNGGHCLYVEDVARRVAMSRRALERRFRAVLRRSPYEEILRVHLERARQLLLDTDLSIKQIAAASGFGEARQLTVAFHLKFGSTPTAYRQRCRLG